MKFYDIRNKGLKFPIYHNGSCVIKAGTKNVKIAFRQSPLVRDVEGHVYPSTDVPAGGHRLNVYLYKTKIYHY